jgi:pimeloyl-ACP methyl ester carboxylesterase
VHSNQQLNHAPQSAFARILSRPVYAIDTRNHGDSPHDKTHNYTALAEDVEAFLSKHNLKNTTLIGHSMGAKTVMAMALRNPDCCANIIPVDNAPVDAALSSDFPKYAEGMKRVAEAKPKTQKHADELMQPYAKELPVRQFLLTNLMRTQPGEPLTWRIPVNTLSRSLDAMADFPFNNPEEVSFKKRALFIRGTKSHYVSDETIPIIGRFFPRFELADVDCGHWVISEKPEEFIKGMCIFKRAKRSVLTVCSGCRVPSGGGVESLIYAIVLYIARLRRLRSIDCTYTHRMVGRYFVYPRFALQRTFGMLLNSRITLSVGNPEQSTAERHTQREPWHVIPRIDCALSLTVVSS